jgi:hypothetical protein
MRRKPEFPSSERIWAYRTDHKCSLFYAHEFLKDQYDAELLGWLTDAVELLLEERGVASDTPTPSGSK